MRRGAWVAGLAVLLSLGCAGGATGATLQRVGEFSRPIFVTSDPADPDRLFVAEREGRVIEVAGGGIGEFADLTPWVSCCEGERGLLSIAPAPDFDSSGRFYAAYAGTVAAGGAEGDLHVDAFRHSGGVLLREPVMAIGHATYANHNGGQLQFGPDGFLYLSTGDGGSGGDPLESGQDLDVLLGKIVRIDPRPGAVPAYAVPAGNPFLEQPGLDEIWSYGLRNPWRFSFDRASGDLVVGDVGQGEWEEVDFEPSPSPGVVAGAGANYGWNCREGAHDYFEPAEACEGASGFTDPVFEYPHADPGGGKAHGCAITGGYVVRDPSLGDLYGRYVYADFCVGEIRSLALPAAAGEPAADDRSEGLSVPNPSSFGEDSCGRIYVISNGGVVYRLAGATPADCLSPVAVSSSGQAPGVGGVPTRRPARVRLGLTLRAGAGSKLVLQVLVSPCAENAGRAVQLNRGGKRFAGKRLNRNCTARFRVRAGSRSTFRALLLPTGTAAASRSRRLLVAARD